MGTATESEEKERRLKSEEGEEDRQHQLVVWRKKDTKVIKM